MTLLITGGGGFVLANLARLWLDTTPDPDSRDIVILDAAPPDPVFQHAFADAGDRLTYVQADVTRPESWAATVEGRSIRAIVHAATITPNTQGPEGKSRVVPERDIPARILEVNIMGTVHMLDFARRCPDLKRFIYVSSGSVYGDDGPETSGAPLPEDGWVEPHAFYAISKYSSELITRRYSEMFGLSAA